MKIEPVDQLGDSRTGSLEDLSYADICRILGFKPNLRDDPDKVRYSWGFTVDGVRCGIWDYKGSHRSNRWSTFGSAETLRAVFGTHYTS